MVRDVRIRVGRFPVHRSGQLVFAAYHQDIQESKSPLFFLMWFLLNCEFTSWVTFVLLNCFKFRFSLLQMLCTSCWLTIGVVSPVCLLHFPESNQKFLEHWHLAAIWVQSVASSYLILADEQAALGGSNVDGSHYPFLRFSVTFLPDGQMLLILDVPWHLSYLCPYISSLETSACSHTVINITQRKICLYALTTHTYVIRNTIDIVMHRDSQLLLTSLASTEDFPVYEVMQFFH